MNYNFNNIDNHYAFAFKFKNKKKVEQKKISFINKLIKNTRMADNNFGFFSNKPGESQILINNFSEIKIRKENNNNDKNSL